MAKGIFKRPNSQYYWIRYIGLDGLVVRESTGSTKFRDAEAMLIKRKQAIREGKQPEVKRISNFTFAALAGEYLTWAERQRSFSSKQFLIRQLIGQWGAYPLRRISPIMIEQFQTDRIKKGNKPATANRLVATLKHMFTKAVEWDMVEDETLKRVHRVRLLEENNRRLRYLSVEECGNLTDSCSPTIRPIVITGLHTGMRKGEILNLRWDNVDLKHGFILLDKTKNGDRREIPINETLREALTRIVRRLDSPYVFCSPDTCRPYRDIKKGFATALRKAKLSDFRFHDLRHTFASHLVMSGVDLTTVRELLGHKTLTMTLRYAHLAPSHKVKAVDILDSTLSGSTAHLLHTAMKKGLTVSG